MSFVIKFYAICPRQLNIVIVTCAILQLKTNHLQLKKPIINMKIPCITIYNKPQNQHKNIQKRFASPIVTIVILPIICPFNYLYR